MSWSFVQGTYKTRRAESSVSESESNINLSRLGSGDGGSSEKTNWPSSSSSSSSSSTFVSDRQAFNHLKRRLPLPDVCLRLNIQ
jgi:hypothetical protein